MYFGALLDPLLEVEPQAAAVFQEKVLLRNVRLQSLGAGHHRNLRQGDQRSSARLWRYIHDENRGVVLVDGEEVEAVPLRGDRQKARA